MARWKPSLHYPVWITIAAGIGYGTDWFATQFTLPDSLIAIVYPNMGIMVALGVLVGPWIAIGAFIGEMALQTPGAGPLPALGFAFAGSAQVFVVSSIVRRFIGGRTAFATRAGVIRFAVLGGFAGTMISATGGVATLLAARFITRADLVMSWLTWWAADIVSVLLITPFIILWAIPRYEDTGTIRDRVLIGATALAAAAVILIQPFQASGFLLAILGLPVVGWTAFRLCSRSVATVSLLLGAAAFAHLAVPWRIGEADIVALLEAQTFIALASIVGLTVAASVREERRKLKDAAEAHYAAVNNTRNRLLQTFAHELNNPLTPMILELDLLAAKQPIGSAKGEDPLGTLRRNAMRLSRLVRDLRDVSHLQAGDRLRLEARTTDISETVGDVVNSYQAAAQTAGVTLKVEAAERINGKVDPDRISQVLSNLIDNAIKYTPAGRSVDVRLRADNDYVEIAVRDEGCGLTPEQAAKLYTPFGQVQPESVQKSGTGLGLHIARGIVESHGGRLDCASEGQGRGATFTVRLPRDLPSPAAATRVPVPEGVTA